MEEIKYPTEEELKIIENWDFNTNFTEEIPKFLTFIKDLWWMSDWGWTEKKEEENGNNVTNLYLSTGGWSGNEDLIDAMKNTFFWKFCWKQHRRGGHYIFEILKH